MSKDNMLLGFARGKVGSLVFARRAGVQVTRAYNSNPANPRTSGQMAQRMLMSTAIQAYRFMSRITDHSFEDAVGKAGCMSAFISAALRDLKSTPANFAFQRYGDRSLCLGPYQISAGSLPKLAAPAITTTVDNAKFVFDALSGSTVKIADIAAKLGLYKVGDMCTVVFCYPSAIGGSAFAYLRATLVSDPGQQTVEIDNWVPSAYIRVQGSSGLAVKNNATFVNDAGAIVIEVDAAPAWLPSAGADYFSRAAINSRYEDGKWLRSPATLVMGAGFVPAPTYAAALATYPQNSEPVLNGGNL